MKKEDFDDKVYTLMDTSFNGIRYNTMELKQQISDYVRFLKRHGEIDRQEDLNRKSGIEDLLRQTNEKIDKGYRAADELIKVLKCVFK